MSDAFFSFLGAFLGGLVTFVGVFFTIRFERKLNERKLNLDSCPIIHAHLMPKTKATLELLNPDVPTFFAIDVGFNLKVVNNNPAQNIHLINEKLSFSDPDLHNHIEYGHHLPNSCLSKDEEMPFISEINIDGPFDKEDFIRKKSGILEINNKVTFEYENVYSKTYLLVVDYKISFLFVHESIDTPNFRAFSPFFKSNQIDSVQIEPNLEKTINIYYGLESVNTRIISDDKEIMSHKKKNAWK